MVIIRGLTLGHVIYEQQLMSLSFLFPFHIPLSLSLSHSLPTIFWSLSASFHHDMMKRIFFFVGIHQKILYILLLYPNCKNLAKPLDTLPNERSHYTIIIIINIITVRIFFIIINIHDTLQSCVKYHHSH